MPRPIDTSYNAYARHDIRYCDLSIDEWQVLETTTRSSAAHHPTRCSFASVSAVQCFFCLAIVALILSVTSDSGLMTLRDVYAPSLNSSALSYKLAETQAGFNIFTYTQTSTVINRSAVVDSTFTSVYSSAVSSSCHYAVYSDITAFQSWQHGKYQPIGEQIEQQLPSTACTAWQASRVFFFLFWILLFASTVVVVGCILIISALVAQSHQLREAMRQQRDGDGEYSTSRVKAGHSRPQPQFVESRPAVGGGE